MAEENKGFAAMDTKAESIHESAETPHIAPTQTELAPASATPVTPATAPIAPVAPAVSHISTPVAEPRANAQQEIHSTAKPDQEAANASDADKEKAAREQAEREREQLLASSATHNPRPQIAANQAPGSFATGAQHVVGSDIVDGAPPGIAPPTVPGGGSFNPVTHEVTHDPNSPESTQDGPTVRHRGPVLGDDIMTNAEGTLIVPTGSPSGEPDITMPAASVTHRLAH